MTCSQCGYEGILTTSLCMTCFEKVKQEGRVEGVIGELKDTLTTLKAIDNILDSYESAQSLKLLIKVKEKRLKSLESGRE